MRSGDQSSITRSWSSAITPPPPRWPSFAWQINHTPATRSAKPLENNFLTSLSGAGISSTLSPTPWEIWAYWLTSDSKSLFLH
ncbi:hypothetical protein PCANC_21565 [Puccinia coronata f. sp. avenae]|uniref:Uncharacterized protein n=1 Tax=Puccinia coronata f. sp. avenae TaxID=200324 RepID=A0A2N5U8X9_9BASI|nr:hypothetical protein PCANC_21565 [Puccinia coronata f. sp. avenae]